MSQQIYILQSHVGFTHRPIAASEDYQFLKQVANNIFEDPAKYEIVELELMKP